MLITISSVALHMSAVCVNPLYNLYILSFWHICREFIFVIEHASSSVARQYRPTISLHFLVSHC